MKTSKETVIEAFLDFVSRQVPLADARLATLGGRGLETKLWMEKGIPLEHAWLIEHNRRKATVLIAQQPYPVTNQLSSFCHILNGIGETSIDGFHLDLCGTFRPSIDRFAPVLPYIIGSRGGCLAITVADARRNPIYENWHHYRALAEQAFGETFANMLFDELLEKQELLPIKLRPPDAPKFLQPFDPLKAARREFGFLIDLVNLLKEKNVGWPVEVERYVYISRYKTRKPFRMRTYFVRFGLEKLTLASFAQKWMTSPLYFVDEAGITRVGKTTKKQAENKSMSTSTSRLEVIAHAIGGEILDEFNALKAEAEKFRAASAIFVTSPLYNADPPELEVPRNGHPGHQPRAHRRQGAQPDTGKQDWFRLKEEQKLRWLVKAFEHKAQVGGDWTRGRVEFLRNEFGYHNADLGRSVRATMARVTRDPGAYVERIHNALPPVEAADLAQRLQASVG